jgi:hypothetical protein
MRVYNIPSPGSTAASVPTGPDKPAGFCGGSLELRHQYVYELLQGTPLTEVTRPRSYPSTKDTSPSCLSDETVYKLTHVEEVLRSSRNSL